MVAAKVRKILICWMAVTACIFLFASCASKKKPAPVAPPPVAKAPEPPNPNPPERRLPHLPGQTELDRDSGREAREERRQREEEREARERDERDHGDADRDAGEDGQGERKRGRRVEDPTSRRKNKNVDVNVTTESEMTPDERTAWGHPTPPGTGATTNILDHNGDQLLYSGSAHDNLLELLKDRMANVSDPIVRQRNLDFAREVGFVKVYFEKGSRKLRVTVLLDRYGEKEHYNYDTVLDKNFHASFGHYDTKPYIAGELDCLDQDGGCRNMRIQLTDKEKLREPRIAYVIVRDTTAAMLIKGNAPHTSTNEEFRRLMKFFLNSVKNPGAINAVKYLNLKTSETVNGQATFYVTMLMDIEHRTDKRRVLRDSLRWTGPLVKADYHNTVNVHVDPVPSLKRIDDVSIPIDPDRDRVSSTIRSIQLIRNDGDGTLQFKVTVRAQRISDVEENILLTIKRKHTLPRYDKL